MLIHLRGILARHILRHLTLPFFCCMAGFLFLFVIVDLQDDLGDLLRTKQGIDTVLYFVYLQPQNLPWVTPMAMLLATMYSFSNLNKNSEITAAKGSGISLINLSQPVFAFAFLVSVLLFLSSEYLVPSFNTKTDMIQERMRNRNLSKVRQNFIFNHDDKVLQWSALFGQGKFEDVSINVYNQDRALLKDFYAKEARYDKTNGWTLLNGQSSIYENGDSKGAPKNFESHKLEILKDSPADLKTYSFNQKFMSLESIRKKLDSNVYIPEKNRDKLETQFWNQIAFPFSCIVAVLLGVPISVAGQRQVAMVAVVKGLLIMFAYYGLVQLFIALGNAGTLPPFLAGVTPTIGFISWGVFELVRKK